MLDLKIKKIFVDDNFCLHVAFANGEMRCVNLKTWIDGDSKIKKDLDFCKQAFIEHGCIISWPTGISIDPEIIFSDGKKNQQVSTRKKPASHGKLPPKTQSSSKKNG